VGIRLVKNRAAVLKVSEKSRFGLRTFLSIRKACKLSFANVYHNRTPHVT